MKQVIPYLLALPLLFASALASADLSEAVFPAPGPAAPAAEPAPAPTAVPPPNAAPPEALAPVPPEKGEAMSDLRKEVTGLRSEVKQLSETLDLLVNRVMKDLETENDQLRNEVRRAYDSGASGPQVPRPGGQLIDRVLSEQPLPPPEDAGAAADAQPSAAQPPLPINKPITFSYHIIQEWGRTPEAVAEMGGGTGSLKGLVCVVPRGSQRPELEQMGRDLRAKFDDYDNINIEAFDDETAAKNYAEQNKMSPSHRVLSVSKHQASGRDAILYYENGTVYEIGR